MDAMESAVRHALSYTGIAESERSKLGKGDHSVLAPGDGRELMLSAMPISLRAEFRDIESRFSTGDAHRRRVARETSRVARTVRRDWDDL
jgi:hypothetical protein